MESVDPVLGFSPFAIQMSGCSDPKPVARKKPKKKKVDPILGFYIGKVNWVETVDPKMEKSRPQEKKQTPYLDFKGKMNRVEKVHPKMEKNVDPTEKGRLHTWFW